jgi:hypothetical protein
LAGRKSQNTKGGYNKTFNPDQEEGLKQFIDFLIYLGHKADLKTVRAAANKDSGRERVHPPGDTNLRTVISTS